MKLFGNSKRLKPAAQEETAAAKLPVAEAAPGAEAPQPVDAAGAVPTTEELMRAAEAAADAPPEEAPSPAPLEEAPGPDEKKSGKKRAALIVLGVVGVLIILTAAVFGGGAMYVKNYDGVYPRVSVAGTNLGELSLQEAEITLAKGVLKDADAVAITVKMPGGELELSYRDIGVDMTAEDAAQLAYDYGRDGSVLGNTVKFLGCMIGGKDLTDEVFGTPDEAALRTLVQQAVADAKAALASDIEIDPEAQTMTVVKGASRIQLDEDEILKLILRALEQRAYGVLDYAPEVAETTGDEIAALREQYCMEAQDAHYDKENDTIVPEVIGIDFDDDEVRKQWDAAANGEAVALKVTVTMPEMTAAHLEEVLFSKVLAESQTTIKWSNDNRKNNIRLAAEALNGTVLLPGEQFSYNETLGERTKERGYKLAGAYSGGQTVSEYGGGICQASSALYYCSLLSNLQIDQRQNHTFRVGYLPPSYDATVSWGGPDYQFTNNREYPIRIKAYTTDDSLFVSIEGTDDGTYVKLTYSAWQAYDDKEYPDVATGLWAQATRWVYDSETDKLLKKTKEKSGLYQYHEEDIEYPEEEPSPTPTPTATPTPAVSTTPAVTPPPETTVQPTTAPTPTPVPETPAPTPVPAPTPEPQPDSTPDASGGESGAA